jgi:hypothetical protein
VKLTEKMRLASRVAEKVNRGDKMLALAWVGKSYTLLTVEDWAAVLANKRATHEDLVAIYAPGITAEQVLDDLRAH